MAELSVEPQLPERAGFRLSSAVARPPLQVGSGLTLLLGGARSGKSDLAVETAKQWSGQVAFVATAEALDEDMADRISAHKQDRPESWDLIEAPRLNVSDVANLDDTSLVIVDCLTVLASNLLLSGLTESQVITHIDAVAADLALRHPPTLMISNEVGMGVHPATKLGSRYRDTLGRVNVAVARHALVVALVLAGRVLPLADLELRADSERLATQMPKGSNDDF